MHMRGWSAWRLHLPKLQAEEQEVMDLSVVEDGDIIAVRNPKFDIGTTEDEEWCTYYIMTDDGKLKEVPWWEASQYQKRHNARKDNANGPGN